MDAVFLAYRPTLSLVRLLSWALAAMFLALAVHAAAAEESIEQRRQRVAALSPAEKEDLRRCYERFTSLDPAEQAQLRTLHDEIQRDPQAAQLQGIMDRYQKWLATLPPYRRAELMNLGSEERIKKIKSLREEQRLRPQDVAGVKRWFEQYGGRHETGIFYQNLPEKTRRALNQMSSAERKRLIGVLLTWRGPPPGEQEMATLRANLTPETQQRLAGKSTTELWQIVAEAMREFHQQTAERGGKSPWAAMVNDSELARYFENLSFEQRDHLLTLPADEMQRDLRQMYLTRSKGGSDGMEPRPGHTGMGKHAGMGGRSRKNSSGTAGFDPTKAAPPGN